MRGWCGSRQFEPAVPGVGGFSLRSVGLTGIGTMTKFLAVSQRLKRVLNAKEFHARDPKERPSRAAPRCL